MSYCIQRGPADIILIKHSLSHSLHARATTPGTFVLDGALGAEVPASDVLCQIKLGVTDTIPDYQKSRAFASMMGAE